MSHWAQAYVAAWATTCLAAAAVALRHRRKLELFQKRYWKFLAQPWKLVTFGISGAAVTFLGPYTTDPTWDWVDGSLMSILAFATAPWAVATIYRFAARKIGFDVLFVAACTWLFSASWCYDLYLLMRDGFYPETWWSNLIASSVLYACAGLFWSLEWKRGKGTVLAFRERDWPQAKSRTEFRRILWIGLPLMALVAWMLLALVRR